MFGHAFFAAISFISILLINIYATDGSQEIKSKFLVKPDKSIKYFSFGYEENVVDGLWVRVIQDYDHCDQKRIEAAGLKKEDQPISGKNRTFNCSKGWVFRMLDVITDLAPKFRTPIATGGVILSVLVDDIEGATVIFDKGVQNFPGDWPILYRAAYHYLYEEEDATRAAELLVQAAKSGGPNWLVGLAAKLYTKEGKAFLAKTVLQETISELDVDAEYVGRLHQRLNEVNQDLKKATEK